MSGGNFRGGIEVAVAPELLPYPHQDPDSGLVAQDIATRDSLTLNGRPLQRIASVRLYNQGAPCH